MQGCPTAMLLQTSITPRSARLIPRSTPPPQGILAPAVPSTSTGIGAHIDGDRAANSPETRVDIVDTGMRPSLGVIPFMYVWHLHRRATDNGESTQIRESPGVSKQVWRVGSDSQVRSLAFKEGRYKYTFMQEPPTHQHDSDVKITRYLVLCWSISSCVPDSGA